MTSEVTFTSVWLFTPPASHWRFLLVDPFLQHIPVVTETLIYCDTISPNFQGLLKIESYFRVRGTF